MSHRVILVDDASPDDTIALVRSEFPAVDIVELGLNSGYASACNRGISHGDAEIVVLLNNDVNADQRMLELLVAPFATENSIGSTVPLLLQPNGRVDAFGVSVDVTMACFNRYHDARIEQVSSESPTILGAYGAAGAYRRMALEQVGALDQSLFMYGEDLDLALRLRNAGWGVAAVPEARGVHVGGASIGKNSPRQRYLAGFGRGYLLRAYGILLTRQWLRTLFTETVVGVFRIVISRDLAAVEGRIAGWKAGSSAEKRSRPRDGVDQTITLFMSLQMRSPSFWIKHDGTVKSEHA